MSEHEVLPASLLERARAQLRAGAVADAWASCLSAVAAARASNDAPALADAAVLLPVSAAGAWDLAAEQHALCREALLALGDTDPVRTTRLRAHLASTSNPFGRMTDGAQSVPDVPDLAGVARLDDRSRFLLLQARYAELVGPEHVHERLALAEDYERIAAERPDADYGAWASLRRAEALYQLGLRIDLDAELMDLSGAVRRLGDPVWRWRLQTVRASVALLDGSTEQARDLMDEALRIGRACGLEEAEFIDLVLRSRLAVVSGDDLEDVERRVRAALIGAPFFARGWHAQILAALGRHDEVRAIWRALAPHVDAMPRRAPEWFIATAGHAELCVRLGDIQAAPRLYALLLPFEGLHVVGSPQTPPYGPVAYALGRLAALLGDVGAARRHLTAAVQESDGMHAPAFARAAREGLASLGEQAGPLTEREHEIANLVSRGLSNREIAASLHLSERTVENHVSHVLRKLDLPNRSAITRWTVGR